MNNIFIVLSTAITDNHYTDSNITKNQRIAEYKECFDFLKKLGYNFTIVETVQPKSDFLEKHSNNVVYTNVNKTYNNRGANYVNAFKKFLNHSSFNDDDIIIHITGRYPLVNDFFFKTCLELEKAKIGCFKKDSHNQFYLFLYAMRFKYLKDLLNSINVNYMEQNMINLERIFSNQIPHDSVKMVDYLGIFGRQSNEKDPNKYGKIEF